MILFWLCSFLTLGGALVATLAGDVRISILALWLAGFGAGGIYLSLGAELLAVLQWVVSTLITLSFIFYAVTYGEYGTPDPRSLPKRAVGGIFPILLGGSFSAVLWLGTRHLPSAGAFVPADGLNLAGVGKTLVSKHLLSLELLVVLLFLVIVGAGVVARPESEEK